MAVNFVEAAEAALSKQSQPRTFSSRKNPFLFLSENQKVTFRPVYNLTECNDLVVMKHFVWNNVTKSVDVDNVCAQEIGQPCFHCEQFVKSEDPKSKLEPRQYFYVPVYVFGIRYMRDTVNQKTKEFIKANTVLSFPNPETGEDVPVSGFRLLELSEFGRIADVFNFMMSFYRDEHDVTVCDFSIEQLGAGTTKSFVTMNKMPKPLEQGILAKRPSIAELRDAILEARQPVIGEQAVAPPPASIPAAEGGYDF